MTRRANDVTRKLLLSETKLIIWDEASNMHKWHFEALEKGLRHMMENDSRWGGKTIVLTGDFQQLLPVIRRGTPHDVILACLRQGHPLHDARAMRQPQCELAYLLMLTTDCPSRRRCCS